MSPAYRPLLGDEADLFATHQHSLRNAVRSAVRGSDDVIEDACSYAWMQLLRHQPYRETVFGWLRTVAIREGWRLAARERSELRVDGLDEELEILHTPIDTDLVVDAHQALETLAALPERQRSCLALLIAGHSYTEIARLTRTSYTAVNKQLVKARSTLRATHHHAN